jgi:signal transduction histidine kinase
MSFRAAPRASGTSEQSRRPPLAHDRRRQAWTARVRPVRAFVLLVVCVLGSVGPAAPTPADPRPRSILVFDEASVGGPFYPAVFSALRSTVHAKSSRPASIFLENLDLSRFRGPDYERKLRDLFEAKYGDKPIGVIVAIGSGALHHVTRLRAELWPDVPLVFAMVTTSRAARAGWPSNATGLTVRQSLADMLDVARRVVPGLRSIVILGDPWKSQVVFGHIGDEIPAARANLEIIDLAGVPMREVRERVRALPDDTAIIYTSMYSDGEGTFYPPAEALAFVAEVANRPIVIGAETFLGRGGIGGYLLTPSAIGEGAGRLALRILDGERASAIPVVEGNFLNPIFDWQQLQRWNVSQSDLPPGSEIRFHTPTAWEQYSSYILLAGAAIVLQAALIGGLIYERRRRRRREAEAREAMFELVQMNRVATAGALTASIAHEVAQPLTGMIASANAAARWLAAETPDVGKARSALMQIVSAGHRTSEVLRGVRAMFEPDTEERRLVDLNELIQSVLTLIRRDLESHAVSVEVELDKELPAVTGDHVQLRQVLLNLSVNAIEAMDDVASRPRVLRMKSERPNRGEILVSIADVGVGVEADKINRIFKPLCTTKPRGMGMGLSICRSIIEAHEGRIWASRGIPYGMVFHFALPASTRVT